MEKEKEELIKKVKEIKKKYEGKEIPDKKLKEKTSTEIKKPEKKLKKESKKETTTKIKKPEKKLKKETPTEIKKPKKESNIVFMTLLIIVIILVIFAIVSYFIIIPKIKSKDTILISFENNNAMKAEIAETPEERTMGLMFRKKLECNEAMIFVYDSEQILNIWMKNTFIPLDIIFINSNKEIVKIVENVEPCTEDPCPTYSSEYPAQYIIEANAGDVKKNELKVGQKVYFEI